MTGAWLALHSSILSSILTLPNLPYEICCVHRQRLCLLIDRLKPASSSILQPKLSNTHLSFSLILWLPSLPLRFLTIVSLYFFPPPFPHLNSFWVFIHSWHTASIPFFFHPSDRRLISLSKPLPHHLLSRNYPSFALHPSLSNWLLIQP